MKVSELLEVIATTPGDTAIYVHIDSAGPGIPDTSFVVTGVYLDAPDQDTPATVIIKLEA